MPVGNAARSRAGKERRIDLGFAYEIVERVDGWLVALLAGQPVVAALAVAALLGLRHASDPDHLVAVTSLVAAHDGDLRAAARLGAWWGAGHAGTLVVVGVPLTFGRSGLPGWLEAGTERAVGVVIALLAGRVVVRWVRGDYRAGSHAHPPGRIHRHLRPGVAPELRRDALPRRQAVAIGVLHGLAGSGALVLLLVSALPSVGEALLALSLFALASIASMALCSSGIAWVLTRRLLTPVYRSVLIPSIGAVGVLFGIGYATVA